MKNSNQIFFRCQECGTKNRIPAERVTSNPRCGKCRHLLDTDELFEIQPMIVTTENFEKKVLKSPLPVLAFAWAPWCPTCRAFLPIIDDYARDVKGKIRVGKLDVDRNSEISSRFKIFSVPQILIFDNGILKEWLPGAMQKYEIQKKMADYI